MSVVYSSRRQAALKHMKSGGRVHHDRFRPWVSVSRAPGLVPYAGTKGAVKMFTSGAGPRDREPGHHGQTTCSLVRSTRKLNPAAGDWAVATEGSHSA